MSIIPVKYIDPASLVGLVSGSRDRLPRILGWLSAAAVSAALWILAVQALKLVL